MSMCETRRISSRLRCCLWICQGESELVAKEDNLDSVDSNREKKNQDKDEQICEEETEKIHEQGDEVTINHLKLFPTFSSSFSL